MRLIANGKWICRFIYQACFSRKFLYMKMLAFFMLLAICTVHGRTFSQNVNLELRNDPLRKAVHLLQKQSGYSFIYDRKLLDKEARVSLSLNNIQLKQALDIIFKNSQLTYTIRDKFIIIAPKPMRPGSAVSMPVFPGEPKAIVIEDVRGRVVDSSGNPIAGVTVQVKGKTSGTATDDNGNFSIQAQPGDILVINSIGYTSQEVKVVGGSGMITVVLLTQPQEIERVVITALGIKTAERSLTYNVQEFKNEDITRNKDANFVNALTGKVAGVTINASSSGIGGATRVVMRGTKSISQNNNALYVIDGIPVPNNNGGSTTGPFQGVVSGEGISSINPEDIESITALTGPSAAALYGSQGANGVILVTTKKGDAGKMKIDFSHSSDFFSPFVTPKFQNTYGQADPLQMQSWGAKLATPSSYNPKDFFQTGYNTFNSASFSGGTEKSQTFFSVGSNNAEGIIPNNTYDRYNAYLRQNVNFTKNLSVDFNAMYVKSQDENMIAQGQYHNPLVPVYLFPPGDDIQKYQVYQRYDPSAKLPLQFWPFGNQGLEMENPYWITNAESNRNKIDRYMLSLNATYKILDWLNIAGRVRMDNSNMVNEVKRPAGTDGLFASSLGFYSLAKTNLKSTYADLIASISHRIMPDLNLESNIGASILNEKSDVLSAGGNLTKLANFYTIENTGSLPTAGYGPITPHEEQAVFATAELGYKRWLYLKLTGRNEWSSALAGANIKSYFYPSVGLSSVLSEALHLPKDVLSYAKVRFSYAEVGNAPAPGITNQTFPLVQGGANTYYPAPFPEFKPERTRSYEAGLELKFLRNKLSFNATLYKSNTYIQLLDYTSNSTLFTDYYYNAGDIENRGIEASLGYNNNFGGLTWSTNAIFSLNKNIVKRLSEGYVNPATGEVFGRDSIRNGTIGNDLINILAIGGSMSDLYITQVLQEDNQGFLYVDPASGNIGKTNIPARYIGSAAPDFNIGWRNSLSYKNVDLSFLVDARVGGIGISYTQAIMDAYGVSEQSAKDRDNGGVSIYGKKFQDVEQFYETIGGASGGSAGMAAYYVYSATNVRLREAALGYTIPGSLFGNKIKNIHIAITGRNLFMFYNKAPFDPESTASTGTYFQGIDYFRQPSYRSIGFSLKAQF